MINNNTSLVVLFLSQLMIDALAQEERNDILTSLMTFIPTQVVEWVAAAKGSSYNYVLTMLSSH